MRHTHQRMSEPGWGTVVTTQWRTLPRSQAVSLFLQSNRAALCKREIAARYYSIAGQRPATPLSPTEPARARAQQ